MTTRNTAKTVLIDRDGVLNHDLPGSVRHPDQLSLIPEALVALRLLAKADYQILVLTNQACVGRGDTSLAMLDRIHDRLRERVQAAGGRIDGIFVCCHQDSDNCACRKPRAGLIFAAQEDWQFDLSSTWLVGDDVRDIEAAQAAGCRPALVLTGKGLAAAKTCPTIPTFANLLLFVNALLGQSAAA